MNKLIKQILCGHNYKGGIRVETKRFLLWDKKRYYSECKLCGKKKYV